MGWSWFFVACALMGVPGADSLAAYGAFRRAADGEADGLGRYASAFVVGLLGGVHCVGMCGGIVGACLSACHVNGVALADLLSYNAGRISSYTLAGAIWVRPRVLFLRPVAGADHQSCC